MAAFRSESFGAALVDAALQISPELEVERRYIRGLRRPGVRRFPAVHAGTETEVRLQPLEGDVGGVRVSRTVLLEPEKVKLCLVFSLWAFPEAIERCCVLLFGNGGCRSVFVLEPKGSDDAFDAESAPRRDLLTVK